MILFAYPNNFRFIIAEPNTSTKWPIRSNTQRSQMIISFHIIEKIMIRPQLVSFIIADKVFVPWSKTIIFAWNSETVKYFLHCQLKFYYLVFAHARSQIPIFYIFCYSSSHGYIVKIGLNIR